MLKRGTVYKGKRKLRKTIFGVWDTKKIPVTQKKEKIKAETENWKNVPSIGIENI